MTRTRLIAIAGGSGSGKTHLGERLGKALAPSAAVFRLDHFYHDLRHLPPSERDRVNFDEPSAIDWQEVEESLTRLKEGRAAEIPNYDFASHTRLPDCLRMESRSFIVVDGLWTLTRPRIRELSSLTIFVDCPPELRLSRRIARDTRERGRSEPSIRRQFEQQVSPMHALHVQPQAALADLVMVSPISDESMTSLLHHPTFTTA